MNADQPAGVVQALRTSDSSVMLEVLVASIAAGLMLRLELRVQRALGVDILKDGLDHDVGAVHAVAGDVHLSRASAAAALAGILGALVEEGFGALRSPAATNSSLRSCKVTVRPRKAPHAAMSPPMTPAPMTCTCLNSARELAAQSLEPVLQEKYPDQIARVGVHISSRWSAPPQRRRPHPGRRSGATDRRWRRAPGSARGARWLLSVAAVRWRSPAAGPRGSTVGRRRARCASRGACLSNARARFSMSAGGANSSTSPVASALRAPEWATLQHEFQGIARPDSAHGAHRAAKSRVNSQQHLGKSQGQGRLIRADPIACRPAPIQGPLPAQSHGAAPRWGRAGPRFVE